MSLDRGIIDDSIMLAVLQKEVFKALPAFACESEAG